MRVIAGRARGHTLKSPKSERTRPTPDRVREALFSMLTGITPGARVLDLFAGTGALGLEAISRGASHALFVEADRGAKAVLDANVDMIRSACPDAVLETWQSSAERAVDRLARETRCFDLVFLDPPYAAGLLEPTLARLIQGGLVNEASLVICEHASRDEPPTPPAGWSVTRTRAYGDVSVSLVEKG